MSKESKQYSKNIDAVPPTTPFAGYDKDSNLSALWASSGEFRLFQLYERATVIRPTGEVYSAH